MPDARCTRSLACKNKKAHEVVTTGSPGATRHSPRNGFNGLLRDLPGDRLDCHRRLADMAGPRPVGPTSPPQNLTPASRRQDHTTSPSATTSFVCAPVLAHGLDPALRFRLRADAAASTASPAQRPWRSRNAPLSGRDPL